MSDNRWRNGFAVGLGIGVFGALLIGLSAGYLSDYLPNTDSEPNNANQKEPQNERWWLIGRIVYMDDTAAQWIMMLFTIAAVYLIWRTLVSTQEMVSDTRKIGQRQVRAYVNVKAIHAHDVLVSERPYVTYTIHNAGQSPARGARLRAHLGYEEKGKRRKFPAYGDTELSIIDIPAQTGFVNRIDFPPGEITEKHIEVLKSEQVRVVFAGYVFYRDVFGVRRGSTFRAYMKPIIPADGKVEFTAASRNNYST